MEIKILFLKISTSNFLASHGCDKVLENVTWVSAKGSQTRSQNKGPERAIHMLFKTL